MPRSKQDAMRRKRNRGRIKKEAPLPILGNRDNVLDLPCVYFTGYLRGSSVVVQHSGDMDFLYKMGFFGKGGLSRSDPSFASRQQRVNVPRVNDKNSSDGRETIQAVVMSKRRYLAHLRYQALSDDEESDYNAIIQQEQAQLPPFEDVDDDDDDEEEDGDEDEDYDDEEEEFGANGQSMRFGIPYNDRSMYGAGGDLASLELSNLPRSYLVALMNQVAMFSRERITTFVCVPHSLSDMKAKYVSLRQKQVEFVEDLAKGREPGATTSSSSGFGKKGVINLDESESDPVVILNSDDSSKSEEDDDDDDDDEKDNRGGDGGVNNGDNGRKKKTSDAAKGWDDSDDEGDADFWGMGDGEKKKEEKVGGEKTTSQNVASESECSQNASKQFNTADKMKDLLVEKDGNSEKDGEKEEVSPRVDEKMSVDDEGKEKEEALGNSSASGLKKDGKTIDDKNPEDKKELVTGDEKTGNDLNKAKADNGYKGLIIEDDISDDDSDTAGSRKPDHSSKTDANDNDGDDDDDDVICMEEGSAQPAKLHQYLSQGSSNNPNRMPIVTKSLCFMTAVTEEPKFIEAKVGYRTWDSVLHFNYSGDPIHLPTAMGILDEGETIPSEPDVKTVPSCRAVYERIYPPVNSLLTDPDSKGSVIKQRREPVPFLEQAHASLQHVLKSRNPLPLSSSKPSSLLHSSSHTGGHHHRHHQQSSSSGSTNTRHHHHHHRHSHPSRQFVQVNKPTSMGDASSPFLHPSSYTTHSQLRHHHHHQLSATSKPSSHYHNSTATSSTTFSHPKKFIPYNQQRSSHMNSKTMLSSSSTVLPVSITSSQLHIYLQVFQEEERGGGSQDVSNPIVEKERKSGEDGEKEGKEKDGEKGGEIEEKENNGEKDENDKDGENEVENVDGEKIDDEKSEEENRDDSKILKRLRVELGKTGLLKKLSRENSDSSIDTQSALYKFNELLSQYLVAKCISLDQELSLLRVLMYDSSSDSSFLPREVVVEIKSKLSPGQVRCLLERMDFVQDCLEDRKAEEQGFKSGEVITIDLSEDEEEEDEEDEDDGGGGSGDEEEFSGDTLKGSSSSMRRNSKCDSLVTGTKEENDVGDTKKEGSSSEGQGSKRRLDTSSDSESKEKKASIEEGDEHSNSKPLLKKTKLGDDDDDDMAEAGNDLCLNEKGESGGGHDGIGCGKKSSQENSVAKSADVSDDTKTKGETKNGEGVGNGRVVASRQDEAEEDMDVSTKKKDDDDDDDKDRKKGEIGQGVNEDDGETVRMKKNDGTTGKEKSLGKDGISEDFDMTLDVRGGVVNNTNNASVSAAKGQGNRHYRSSGVGNNKLAGDVSEAYKEIYIGSSDDEEEEDEEEEMEEGEVYKDVRGVMHHRAGGRGNSSSVPYKKRKMVLSAYKSYCAEDDEDGDSFVIADTSGEDDFGEEEEGGMNLGGGRGRGVVDWMMRRSQKWRPCLKKDPYKTRERLHLMLEEAFFLTYGLGCLTVLDTELKPLGISDLWQRYALTEEKFIPRYVCYHYFRSKGWVPKAGLKFGCDFILYREGPPFYHGSYSVVVVPVREGTLAHMCWEDGELDFSQRWMSWISLANLNRVTEHVSKELMFCFVIFPKGLTEEDTKSPQCIPRFKVKEVVVNRSVSAREREARDFDDEMQIP